MRDWLDEFFNTKRACYVVAEVGANHMGDPGVAINIMEAAVEAGASAVKFQMRDVDSLYTRDFASSPYVGDLSFGSTYGEHRKTLEIDLRPVREECSVPFIVTPSDEVSLEKAEGLSPDAYKIASGDLTNIPVISRVEEKGRPVFLSTGGGSFEDVTRAYQVIRDTRCAIYHCVSSYPAQPRDMNLQVIGKFFNVFPVPIGLSDHSNGILMPVLAYMLKARVIEKHFTLDRTWKGRDQSFSLEPQGMRKLVRDLDRADLSMGDGYKRRMDSEDLHKMEKSLVFARDLPKGHPLQEGDFVAKCPGGGLPPYTSVSGKTLKEPVRQDQLVDFNILD